MPSIGKVRLVFGIIIILITLISVEVVWQYRPIAWGPESQVTFGLGDSRIVDIAADPSGALHLVWEDTRDGSNQVYYKGSTDNGLTWGPDIRLSNLSTHTIEPLPRVAANGGHLLVFFSVGTGNGEHLLYAASMDSGSTFAAQKELTNDRGYQTNAAVSADGITVHLVWQNFLEGDEHIYYMKSLDAGSTWSPEAVLTSTTGQDRHPAITSFGKNIFVAWTRYDQGEDAVFFRASHDSGATWLPEVQLSGYEPQAYSIFPSIATNGTRIDVVWNSGRVLYVQSSNAGSTWGPLQTLTNQTRQYLAPRVSTLGSHLQLVVAAISMVWNDVNSISADIYYFESLDGGNAWSEPISLTAHYTGLQSLAPAIAVRGDDTFVAWEDNRNGALALFIRSKPDFAELQAFQKTLITYALTALILTTLSYLLLEIRDRSKRLALAKRRGRRRRRPTARSKRKRRTIR